jgi:4-hydroxythreonine-4-phosphate dehydrogenase
LSDLTPDHRGEHLLAVSGGDPAGIGPEIIIAAWRARLQDEQPFWVCGPASLFAQFVPVITTDDPVKARAAFPKALPVWDCPSDAQIIPGQPDSAHASCIIASLERAVSLVTTAQCAGLVTAPIAKSVLYSAGFSSPGHTEYLDVLTRSLPLKGTRGPIMMLAGGGLKVALATIHTPLRAVADQITPSRIEQVIRVTHEAMISDFAIKRPRIALTGLNPHAGEGGALGSEEIEIINPVAARLRKAGIDVSDAQPGDTLFHAEARSTYDCVIAMSHDQGLIPVKTLDFHGGVNATLGLPIIRTSPDHGTAFDIAGQGKARADSFRAALRLAAEMAQTRHG